MVAIRPVSMRKAVSSTLVVLMLFVPQVLFAWSGMVTGVAEGDSITVRHDNRPEQVRLHGIDCPQRGQDFFDDATKFTCRMVLGKTVDVVPLSIDHHGKTVATIFIDGKCLNEELVREGLAWWYSYYAPTYAKLGELQEQAKVSKTGLWSRPDPVRPWEYREERRPPGIARYVLQELNLKIEDLPERLRTHPKLPQVLGDIARDGKVIFRFSAPGPVAKGVDSGQFYRVGSVVVEKGDQNIDSVLKIAKVVLVLGGAAGEAFQTGNPWKVLTSAANLVTTSGTDGQLTEIQKQLDNVHKQLTTIHGYVKALYDAPFRDATSYLRNAADSEDPVYRKIFLEKACDSFQKARNLGLSLLKEKKRELFESTGLLCVGASGDSRISACTTVSDTLHQAETAARAVDLCYRYEATLRERLKQFKLARGLRTDAVEFKLDMIGHLERYLPEKARQTGGCFSKLVAFSNDKPVLTLDPRTWWDWFRDSSRSKLRAMLAAHDESLRNELEDVTHLVALDLFFLTEPSHVETRLALY